MNSAETVIGEFPGGTLKNVIALKSPPRHTLKHPEDITEQTSFPSVAVSAVGSEIPPMEVALLGTGTLQGTVNVVVADGMNAAAYTEASWLGHSAEQVVGT